jgi:hypothetical protein
LPRSGPRSSWWATGARSALNVSCAQCAARKTSAEPPERHDAGSLWTEFSPVGLGVGLSKSRGGDLARLLFTPRSKGSAGGTRGGSAVERPSPAAYAGSGRHGMWALEACRDGDACKTKTSRARAVASAWWRAGGGFKTSCGRGQNLYFARFFFFPFTHAHTYSHTVSHYIHHIHLSITTQRCAAKLEKEPQRVEQRAEQCAS